MDRIKERYLGPNVPADERLFYLATFLSGVTNILFVSVGLFLNLNFNAGICYALMAFFSLLFFLLEKRFHKTDIFVTVFLCLINYVLYPLIFHFSEYITVEVPLYMMIGFTYALVMLKGVKRIVMCAFQVIEVILLSYYLFVYYNSDDLVYGASSSDEFIRLELSILVTGIICGIMVNYRNKMFKDEMRLREAATKEAEEASFAKDMFLVNVSHELRTPLNAIIGTTDLLLDSNVSSRVREMVDNISNSSRSLINITSELLDFSGNNMDSAIPEIEQYDLGYLINDIVTLMSVRLLDLDICFYTNVNPNIPKYVYGDRDKIRGILINLLSNAFKYTPKGKVVLNVDFNFDADDRISLVFSVSDTGIGIKEENLENIFKPFNRSGDSIDRIIDGNGIGLPLCKKIAELMGGSLTVESKYGEGSTFTFRLMQNYNFELKDTVGCVANKDIRVLIYSENELKSILDENMTNMGVFHNFAGSVSEFLEGCIGNEYDMFITDFSVYEKNKSSLVHTKAALNKLCIICDCNYSNAGEAVELIITRPINCINIADALNKNKSKVKKKLSYNPNLCIENATVLVVDDDITNLTVATGLLSRYKAKVIQAASGKEAIQAMAKYDIDIIFLDYMMPDMDGIDTLKEIRKTEDGIYSSIPAIVLTANVVSGAKEMFMNAGFDDYLSKPIEIDKLEKMLMDYLPEELIEIKAE